MAKRTPDTASAAPATRRTPEMATQARGATHPRIDVSPAYYLVCHPERWTVIDGRLVPSLSKASLTNAVNGVTVDGSGKIRFATARAKLEEEDKIVIPWDWAPDGVSYLQCLDTRDDKGAIHETWLSVWETASVGSSLTEVDSAGYADWLAGLVEDGKLPPCPQAVALRLLSDATSRLEEARAKAARTHGGRATIRAKALEAEVAALEAHIAASKPAPAKGRRATPNMGEGEGAAS